MSFNPFEDHAYAQPGSYPPHDGGVDIGGRHLPWSQGEDEEELRPLNRGFMPFLPSAGADFIRRQTQAHRGATTRRVKLTKQGHWINE